MQISKTLPYTGASLFLPVTTQPAPAGSTIDTKSEEAESPQTPCGMIWLQP